MKILHLVNTLDPRGGGVTEAVIQFCLTLTEAGHENVIVTADDPSKGFTASSTQVVALGPGRTGFGYTAGLIPWLQKHASQFDCAVVHGLWQYHGIATRRVFRQIDRPYFVFAHGMLDVWFKQHYPLKHLKKCLFWPWADYRVLRDAKAVIYTSEFERLSSRKSFKLYQARERVVRYGIVLPEVSSAEAAETFYQKYPELRDKRFLLFLGRVHVKKGLDLLTRAWADLPEASRPVLVIAGPEQEPGLLAQARTLSGDAKDFYFIGMQHSLLKWGALAAAEAMILPSHQENFGLVVAEALIMGTPVLISNKVNIWQEVTEADAGLVEADTLDGTRSLLARWEGMEPEKRKMLAARCIPACEKLFDLRRNTTALIEVLLGH